MKFAANLCIVFHHYQQVTHYSFNYYFDFYYGFFYWGYLVELFFCISGFFAVRYVDRIRDGIRFDKYLMHKLKRFVPPVFVCAVAEVIVLFVYHRVVPSQLWTEWACFNESRDFWMFLTNGLCMNFGGVVNPSNGCMGVVNWTISVIIICDVFLYFIVCIADRIKIKDTYLYVAMIMLGIMLQEYEINYPFFNTVVARGFCAFFSGLILGIHMRKQNGYTIRLWIRALILPITVAAMLISSGQEYLLAIIIFPILISIFTDDKIEKLFAKWRGWKYMGNIGFEVYIWHPVVIAFWLIVVYVKDIDLLVNGFGKMIIFAILCTAVGAVAYRFIEIPIGKIDFTKNKRLKKLIFNDEI